MTIEERVEFLHQSIESHDHQLGEVAERLSELKESQLRTDRQIADLTESQSRTDRQIADLTARMDRGFERVQLNFDRLTTAMLGLTDHIDKHAARLDRLEGTQN